jgi:hypothetical protein
MYACNVSRYPCMYINSHMSYVRTHVYMCAQCVKCTRTRTCRYIISIEREPPVSFLVYCIHTTYTHTTYIQANCIHALLHTYTQTAYIHSYCIHTFTFASKHRMHTNEYKVESHLISHKGVVIFILILLLVQVLM